MATLAVPTANLLRETRNPAQANRLIDRAKKGERPAFFGLFQAHAQRIYALSSEFAEGETAAENLTRDIFVEAFSQVDTVRDDEAFTALLYVCAAKRIIASHAKAEALNLLLERREPLCGVPVGVREISQGACFAPGS